MRQQPARVFRHKFRPEGLCELKEETIGEIRHAANTGLVLGNDHFREQAELLTGQRLRHLKRGPKPKPNSDPSEEFLL